MSGMDLIEEYAEERGAQRERGRILSLFDGAYCILWDGPTDDKGYGAYRIDGQRVKAHRHIYEGIHGPQDGMDIHHKCGNPTCVNPAHLEALTRSEHRLAHASDVCSKGLHYMEGDNILRDSRGYRRCRLCSRHDSRERNIKRRGHAEKSSRRKSSALLDELERTHTVKESE